MEWNERYQNWALHLMNDVSHLGSLK
jgi:hypothetical protein